MGVLTPGGCGALMVCVCVWVVYVGVLTLIVHHESLFVHTE